MAEAKTYVRKQGVTFRRRDAIENLCAKLHVLSCPTYFRVAVHLVNYGDTPRTEMSEVMAWSRGMLTHCMKRLEANGLIKVKLMKGSTGRKLLCQTKALIDLVLPIIKTHNL